MADWQIFLDEDADDMLDWVDAGDLNGLWDEGEGEKWTRTSDGVAEGEELGEYWFEDLGPGTYNVAKSQQTDWLQTTANPEAITGMSGQDHFNVDFGNELQGIDGHTLGFWSNKNGEAQLMDDGTMEAELQLLRDLNLKDADGNDFDPTDYSQLRTWLLEADATNMAYMLSVQMAAMSMNIEAEFVSYNSEVHWFDENGIEQTDKIGDLVNEANMLLGLDSELFAQDENRDLAAALKTAIDGANNNINWAVLWVSP